MTIESESRAAFNELLQLLQEVDRRWASEEWNLATPEDVAGAHRAILHTLEAGLLGWFEYDVRSPDFRRIVSPSRKLTGDNADAWYFDAPVDSTYEYVVQGNMSGAVYFALTIEEGCADGSMADRLGGVINSEELEIDSNGNFTLYLGGPARNSNWLPLGESANRVTTRHYFENVECAAADSLLHPSLKIECVSSGDVPAPSGDAEVAAGIRRVIGFLKNRTIEMPAGSIADNPPPFVSVVPNQFPKPVLPGDMGLAAADAHYSMAPFLIGEDEALVLTGRWPDCLFANVCLWNRHMQIFDYVNRQVSLNRQQTELESDGSFRMIIAHSDPGLPNWLDTEGKPFGIVYWRFFLVNGEVETPVAKVVKLSELC